MTPPFHYANFDAEQLGVDETNGCFGEVSVLTCRRCGSKWLHCLFENESVSRSARWYRGLVTTPMLAELTPERAVGLLERLPWRFCGGSYFDSTGVLVRGSGPLR